MKIVQLLPELNEGGVERGVVELSRELIKRGFESVVISNGGRLVERLEREGSVHVKVDVCSKNPFNAPWRIFVLYRTLKKIRPDLLHVRSRVPAWMVFFANHCLHLPVVSTVHGFNSVGFYSSIMTKTDHVICVSGAIKDFIQTHYDVPDEKISVIPRGIDLTVFNPSTIDRSFIEAFQTRFGLHDRFVVSTVGRITQLKDLETFIRAVAILKKEIPNIVGLVIGGIREDKHAYAASLQSLCASLELDDTVLFCGSLNNVAEIYALSDVTLSCSKKPESFGRSVAEAIAMNTPVVATRHGGVLDIVQEGVNGYFSAIEDAQDLAQKIRQARMLRFDGHTYIAEHFTLQNMVEKTVKVYRFVASSCR